MDLGPLIDLAPLIDSSLRHLNQSGIIGHGLPGLTVLRRETESEIEAVVYEPVVCLILQGRKVTWIGDQVADVGPGDALIVSHHLPVQSRITKASPQEPYLAVILALDLVLVHSLHDEVTDVTVHEASDRSLAAGQTDPAWLAPLRRYLDLLDKPLDAKVLGPSILREIHYRLLISPAGGMLRSLLSADSHASRSARASHRLRSDFRLPISLPELAKTAGMSATLFHKHFKAVTGTTPLQYQKDLRMITARALVAEQGQSVSEAAYAVGYESPTHFSRDFRRKFGLAPSQAAKGNGNLG
ncbi:AraC family transcriptional regulator [Tabrizicola sp.]|uniref:AraC family transcriptional regulator n=1 Tax=Tabrizicola sp. TaxID=2005166 RepID=UPI003F36859E